MAQGLDTAIITPNHPWRRWEVLTLVLTTLLLTLYYASTACLDLFWTDSAELALAGKTLGVSHPPGQPLYILLGHGLVSVLPLPALVVLNLLSCVCMGALFATTWIFARALSQHSNRPWPLVAMMTAYFLFSFVHPFLWNQATKIEVYSLAALLSLGQMTFALKLGDARAHSLGRERSLGLVCGLLLGFLASVHPVLAITNGATTLILLGNRHFPRRTPYLFVGLLLGLLPYLYPFFVSNDGARIIWGDFSTLKSSLFYLTGADYASNRSISTISHLTNIYRWIVHTSTSGYLPIYLLYLISLVGSWKQHWRINLVVWIHFWLMAYFIATNEVFLPDNSDLFGTTLPSMILLLILGARSLEWLTSPTKRSPKVKAWRACLALIFLAWILLPHAKEIIAQNRHEQRMPRERAHLWIDPVEQARGIFVVASDHLFFPALYMQVAEERWPHMVLFNYGWANSSWYWTHLKQRHPDLKLPRRGLGSRHARVRDFLQANRPRPIFVENAELASELIDARCTQAFWLSNRADCNFEAGPHLQLVRNLDLWKKAIDAHADPESRRVLNIVALTRALDLWKSRHHRQALSVLEVALPPSADASLPPLSPDNLPEWTAGHSIGGGPDFRLFQLTPQFHYESNYLYYAVGALLLDARSGLALPYLQKAADNGYPEGQVALCRLYLETNQAELARSACQPEGVQRHLRQITQQR